MSRSPGQLAADQGRARRWVHCVLWRSMFVLLIGPAALACAWHLAVLQTPDLRTNYCQEAYLLLVAQSLVFGGLFWTDSPARLRARLRVYLCQRI